MSARGSFAPGSYAETVGRDVPASFASSSCVSWARLRASEIRSAAVLMVRILSDTHGPLFVGYRGGQAFRRADR